MTDESVSLPADSKKKSKPAELNEKMTIETARAMLSFQEKKRADDCAAKLEALMKEYNCQLSGSFVFDNSGPRIAFQIMALPEK